MPDHVTKELLASCSAVLLLMALGPCSANLRGDQTRELQPGPDTGMCNTVSSTKAL